MSNLRLFYYSPLIFISEAIKKNENQNNGKANLLYEYNNQLEEIVYEMKLMSPKLTSYHKYISRKFVITIARIEKEIREQEIVLREMQKK